MALEPRKVYYCLRFLWIDVKFWRYPGLHGSWGTRWRNAEAKMVAEGRRHGT